MDKITIENTELYINLHRKVSFSFTLQLIHASVSPKPLEEKFNLDHGPG